MREMVMRKLSRWIVGLGTAAWILTITVFPSYADEGHGKMGHGRHDEDINRTTIVGTT
jgi:hypothetical protein